MLRIDKIIKPWKESAALNDHINLYGPWSETVFLTKSGDLGVVLRVPGVDYESLDHAGQEYAVKRLEAALKSFGPGFHVYQYLFKSNRPEIPFASYEDPVVQTEVNHRREFFRAKARRSLSDRDLLLHSSSGCTCKDRHRAGLLQVGRESRACIRRVPGAVRKRRHEDLAAH